MYTKLYLFALTSALLLSCSDDKQNQPSNQQNPAVTKQTPNYAPKPAHPVPGFLEQNWNHDTRMEWWYTSQGSRILPYDWFLALEQPDQQSLLSSKENLENHRFIAWPADPHWNPDGLPIGFVMDKDETTGIRYFGVNCSACHTGKVLYQGKEYVVEGAPAHHDFDRFTSEITSALQQTLSNPDKFTRFAKKVLGAQANAEKSAALKTQVQQEADRLARRVEVNKTPHPNGYARLDAFGDIFNEVTVFAINEPSNQKTVDAPVSFPVLWDTPQHDLVQWNGAATNAGIGPYARNAGEVVGVFGDLHIEKAGAANPTEMTFKNHINIKNIKRLEDILTTLWSPLWPDSLPAIDTSKAKHGEQVFKANCESCHLPIKRDDPERKVSAQLIPAAEIGTDPNMTYNIATRLSKTGLLEGQPVFPIDKFVPNLPKLGAQAQSVQVVLYGVVGILRDGLDVDTLKQGLPSFIESAKKNTFKEGCDLAKEGQKCLLPPRYKARPLNGIWSSAPFLHNGSVPNLTELLKKPELRMASFNVGSWIFDPVNVGFTTTPEPATSQFDTSLPGNSNKGHDYGTGLSDPEKLDLIEYIKTL